MKTIQVTIDEDLLERLDRQLSGAQKARSAFIRAAIERELRRAEIREMEQRHRLGYLRLPPQPDEFEFTPDASFWEDL